MWILKKYIAFIGTWSMLLSVNAQTNEWIGGDGNWNYLANWSLGHPPTSSEDALLDAADATTITIQQFSYAEARSLVVKNNITLKIENGASLEIDGSTSVGIECQGEVKCFGVVSVINSGDVGIEVSGKLVIRPLGFLYIENCNYGIENNGLFINRGPTQIIVKTLNGRGIQNEGRLENYDTISISESGSYGLVNEDTIINFAAGLIEVDSSGHTGIRNDLRLVNFGTISVDSTGSDGLFNNVFGELINEGEMSLTRCGVDALDNKNLVVNRADGVISIIECQGDGVYNFAGEIQNLGGILVVAAGAAGVVNRGHCRNRGTIVIIGTGGDGFRNRDSLYNEPNGQILISQVENEGVGLYNHSNYLSNEGKITISNVAKEGLFNRGTFENKGFIDVGFCEMGLRNWDNFYNYDSIIVHSVMDGVYNRYTNFHNLPGSYFQVRDIEDIGLEISPLDQMVNEGELRISNTGGKGCYIRGSLVNGSEGTISINGSLSVPFECENSAYFECLGAIEIGIDD